MAKPDLKTCLDFLTQLRDNNNRTWFEAHRKEYEHARAQFKTLVGQLIEAIGAFEPAVGVLEPKNALFRIHRDIRFAKDKTPYKTNFGAAMSPEGRKSPWATYYIHLEPGQCMLAGGMYHPDNERLYKIRQEIDYNPGEFKSILEAKDFQKTFGGLAMEGEKLKTAPKGYPKDHPQIEWLKHKNFVVFHEVPEQKVLAEDFRDYAVQAFRTLKPFNDFLNRSLEG